MKTSDIKEKLKTFKARFHIPGCKLWKITISQDCLQSTPWESNKYIYSGENSNAEDVMDWWNKEYYDESRHHGTDWEYGSPKCIKVELHEDEFRDWIVMPSMYKK